MTPPIIPCPRTPSAAAATSPVTRHRPTSPLRGRTAIFRIHWEQVPVGNETNCPMASGLAITPPDEFVPLHVTAQIRACGGGTLNISRVQPE